MSRRTVAVGDLHLVKESPAALTADLRALAESHRGARLVVAGDLFDLSADFPGVPKSVALRRAFDETPHVRAVLAEHVDRGGELWLLAGNHDSAFAEPTARREVVNHLGLVAEAAERVRVSPWFLRDGPLHVEHGHLFDPDNATDHPLASNLRSLGVRFVEDFIAPTGAFRYLNANDGTPAKLFVSAFTWYKWRGPYVVFKYFDTAFRAVLSSGPFRDGAADARTGQARESEFFSEVADESLRVLLGLPRRPTMDSVAATLSRLYLDRVAATCAILAGLGLLAAGEARAARWALGLGGLAMGLSWALGHDRFGGSVPERLREGADAIRRASGAELVVMGHAHRETTSDGYANTGSFAFPRSAPGRPFLEIATRGGRLVAERRHLGVPS
jgi:UDP-2,3-diacylglucosamine pyrophosphatase LpxH